MMVAPKLQRNHRFIDKEIGPWLDIHFGDHSFNGRVFIGHRKNGGGIYTMTARSLSDLRQYILLIHASQRLDYYITANTVSGTNRAIDGLFGLQNIVIDIDCHDKDADAPALVQTFLWRIERDLWSDGTLPRPNSIVRTGRGVQLWWAIKPCHASCRYHYDQIKIGMMNLIDSMLDEYSEMDGLQVDRGASGNPVGYFRLPCTYNTAAKRYSTLQVLHSEPYDTHALWERISAFKPSERISEPQSDIPMQRGDLIVLHNNYSTGANRVMQLIKLRNLRDNAVGAETRNNLCFSVYNALRMSYDHEEAMERLRAYNSGFKQPMSENELQRTICSAEKKGGYKYTNAKLIEFLKITPEEQDAIGLHPFNGVYKPWSHAKPNATRDAVRKARRNGRDSQIITLYRDGISQAEISRRMGISRNTVGKVVKAWNEAVIAADTEIAVDNLFNSGAINDCLLFGEEDVAVSFEDGQLFAPTSKGGVYPFEGAGGGSGRDGP